MIYMVGVIGGPSFFAG